MNSFIAVSFFALVASASASGILGHHAVAYSAPIVEKVIEKTPIYASVRYDHPLPAAHSYQYHEQLTPPTVTTYIAPRVNEHVTYEAHTSPAVTYTAPIVREAPIAYEAPAVHYEAPAVARVAYEAPALAYEAPAVAYEAPAVSYAAPALTYGPPARSFAAW